MTRRRFDCILWDWNGTLLDDVAFCLRALHHLCRSRGIDPPSLDRYREIFTFPVVEYYRAVGFDFSEEPFHVLADEWVAFYTEGVHREARLFDDARPVLHAARAAGYGQVVLSAHEHNALLAAIRHHRLDDCFDDVLGIGDFHAHSKLGLGQRWIARADVAPGRVLFVGDTLHDHEVAGAMGVHCVLVARGHQSRARLETAGVPVLDGLDALRGLLFEPSGEASPRLQ
jgi:phosphoglycolate phosphatase